MAERNPLQVSYDRLAADYAARLADELAGKPLDRALLASFAEQVRPLGPVCDLGCGPGHVAAALAGLGLIAVGFDLAAGMLGQGRRRFPALPFAQADLRALPVRAASLGGISAFYSIIHVAPDELAAAFGDWRRALRPAGRALVAFHIGDHTVHLDEMWEQPVDLDFHFLDPAAVGAALGAAGFAIEAVVERAPYPDVEHQSRRCYIQARNPG
ncbi:MAG TPA: class I SAM-dependent methyltransferase [Herpetosiphonaceae bacterium]|nr:class I SAM-dependent methyltransferase [Herpetosiphonaceae bacterium]